MVTLNIPKKMAKEELVIIPRKEYEHLKAHAALIDDEPMTASEKRALAQSRKDLKAGKLLSFDEFSRKLGFKNTR